MELGAYKTDDMTLATLLAIRGYKYNLEKYTETKAIWAFIYEMDKEEEFDDVIAEYNEFNESVEPRQFVLRLGEIRRELYDLLFPDRKKPSRRLDASAPAA